MEYKEKIKYCIKDIVHSYEELAELKHEQYLLFEKLVNLGKDVGMSEDEVIKSLNGALFDGEIDDFVDYLSDCPMYDGDEVVEGETNELQ